MAVLNLGIVAHVDAGKTTTTEQFLYLTNSIRAVGRVDKGTTQTDWMEIERERGISIKSSSTVIHHNGIQINLIDTPGHVDFAGEVERALSVLDCAILVICAIDGVQGHTKVIWDALKQLSVPTIVFINKVDRAGCDTSTTLLSELSNAGSFIALNEIQNQGSRDCQSVERDLLGEDILLSLAEYDKPVENMLFGEGSLEREYIEKLISRLTNSRKIFPVVYGSSAHGVGVELLLNAVTSYFTPPSPCEELSGVVYKIHYDKQFGKALHVRMYGGQLKNRDTLFNQKITQIKRMYGQKSVDTGVITAGDIGVVYGIDTAKIGDVIGIPYRTPIKLQSPLFTVQILYSEENLPALITAFTQLSDEDPTLNFVWLKEERELHIQIMGTIQLEILKGLMLERYNQEVEFSKPSVIYKETITALGRGVESYTMPKPCWAIVLLKVEPLPPGAGIVFESVARDDKIYKRYQNHVEQSVYEAAKQGVFGWEVIDVLVTLVDGEHHVMHTHPLDFFLATPIAFMRAIESANPILLEPILKVTLRAREDILSRVIGDVIAMRGEFESPRIQGDGFVLSALIPVAEFMEYPTKFATISSGTGQISFVLDSYKPCPTSLGATAKRRGVDPRDRARWILYKRGAIS